MVKWRHNSQISERKFCVQPEEVFNWFLVIRNSPHSSKQEAVTVGLKSLDHSLHQVSTTRRTEQTLGEGTRRIISHVGQVHPSVTQAD